MSTNGDNALPAANGGEQSSVTEPEGGYPPQRHAGAVGLGPEYAKMHRATMSEKIAGVKEEIAGKITHNPEKIQHGKETRTGELKRKKREEDEKTSQLAAVEDEKDEQKKDAQETDRKRTRTGDDEDVASQPSESKASSGQKIQADVEQATSSSDAPDTGNTSVVPPAGRRGPGTHLAEEDAKEEAAMTAPARTEQAEQQRRGENTYADKQIDEAQNMQTSA